MDDIFYLIHVTNDKQCTTWNELITSDFNTTHQFPGCYLSVITKYNINSESIYPGKYILVFSKKLLLQTNYHFNIIDYNGIITEKNTYYPWSIDEFVCKNNNICKQGKHPMSEIVFHDNIDMNYCCRIINIDNKNVKTNNYLPEISIYNDELPDMSKLPFYFFPFEHIYTGYKPLPKSSNEWFNMILKIANITLEKEDKFDKNIEKIKNIAELLYNNRKLQNINVLHDYTYNKKMIDLNINTQ